MIDIRSLPYPSRRTAVAIGYFDGMHKGHLSVLETALSVACEKDLTPVLLTFDMSGARAAGKGNKNLLSPSFRSAKASELGFAYCVTLDFAEISPMNESTFVRDVLHDGLNAGAVICGSDFRFGKGRSGDVSSLKALCAVFGTEVDAVEEVLADGTPVSTSAIKELLENGAVETANSMLGYEYFISGPVIHGNHLACSLGFPTANIDIDPDLICPARGVYFSLTDIDGTTYRSITNIGVRPTVTRDTVPVCETHVIGYEGDLYGRELTVRLLRFLRPEQRFDSVAELVSAVEANVEYAKYAEIPVIASQN